MANFGLDVRSSLSRPTGVGSYVLALATRMPALAPQDLFFFFSASMRERYAQRPWPANAQLGDRRLPPAPIVYRSPPARQLRRRTSKRTKAQLSEMHEVKGAKIIKRVKRLAPHMES